jgi:hypothetical protein
MIENDFARDDAWQRTVRDGVLVPWYAKTFANFVLLDGLGLARILQKRDGVDTVVQSIDGAIFIEEKIVRWPGFQYTDYCIETQSCTTPGHESPGWITTGRADRLLYCFEQADGGLHAHWIDFPKLRAWFLPRQEEFATWGPLETLNGSKGRKVPIAAVAAAVPVKRYSLPRV